MATVDVLVAGHVTETEAGQSVHPTVSLGRVTLLHGLLRDTHGARWRRCRRLDDARIASLLRLASARPGRRSRRPRARTHAPVRDGELVVVVDPGILSDQTLLTDALADRDPALERSRERILAIADVVVPGHGPAFRPASPRGEHR